MPAGKRNKSKGKSSDAIALLKNDHRAVEKLFAAFEKTGDEKRKSSLTQAICTMLAVHMSIEEEDLYPAAHHALQDAGLVYEAEIEHASAKVLIAEIGEMSVADEKFAATVKVLSEYIKHHVKEEESEMFPKLKRARLDLVELGSRMASRREQLMMKAGVREEDVAALTSTARKSPARKLAKERTSNPPSASKRAGRASNRSAERLAAR